MSTRPAIKINLYRDYVNWCRRELIHCDYDVSRITDDNRLVMRYLSVHRRTVTLDRREIKKSKNLYCPPEFKNTLFNIEKIIRQGENLAPYLGKNIKDLYYDDALLNDWGIHHLHLGDEFRKDGFIKRTGQLLFCRFDKNCAYFIKIDKHGTWTSPEMVEIIHENWPETISMFKLSGIMPPSENTSSEDQIKIYRKHNLGHIFQARDGTIYFGIGGGPATSGDNRIDVLFCSRIRKYFRNIENQICDKIHDVLNHDDNTNVIFPDNLTLNLHIMDGDFLVRDTTNFFWFRFRNPSF